MSSLKRAHKRENNWYCPKYHYLTLVSICAVYRIVEDLIAFHFSSQDLLKADSGGTVIGSLENTAWNKRPRSQGGMHVLDEFTD